MADNFATKFLGWLHAGYPEGVPETDYIPLLEILARRLTPEEVQQVAHRLVTEGDINATDEQIRAMIGKVALTPADDQDVRRVAARLAGGGWPLSAREDAARTGEGLRSDETARTDQS